MKYAMMKVYGIVAMVDGYSVGCEVSSKDPVVLDVDVYTEEPEPGK